MAACHGVNHWQCSISSRHHTHRARGGRFRQKVCLSTKGWRDRQRERVEGRERNKKIMKIVSNHGDSDSCFLSKLPSLQPSNCFSIKKGWCLRYKKKDAKPRLICGTTLLLLVFARNTSKPCDYSAEILIWLVIPNHTLLYSTEACPKSNLDL